MEPQSPARRQALAPTASWWKALICAAFALVVWGTKLTIISRFASPAPMNDEWDVHALGLFVPYTESTLSLAQLLAPHNEHRLFLGRLVALLTFAANGAWDPILEMIVNAAIHVAFGVCILAVLGRGLGRYGFVALTLVTTALLAVPNASENPLWGLEVHFYLVLLCGFIAIVLLTRGTGSLLRCGAGIGSATLAFLSLASGALVFLACAAVVVVKLCLGVESRRHGWAVAAALLACFAVAAAVTPVIAAHEVYRAHTAGQFVASFASIAAWPFRVHVFSATLLVNAPLAVLALRMLRRPPAGDDVAWVLLGLGLFGGLQFAALALGRPAGVDSTRYIDICAFNLIVNFCCAVLLADGARKRLLVAAWLAAMAAGWAMDTAIHVPDELAARHSLGLMQERSVRTFLTTGSFPPDARDADLSIPYPNAARLATMLSTPAVRAILPSAFQDAVAGAPVVVPDRLRGGRDGLLSAGPWLGVAGGLLMLVMILVPVGRRRERQLNIVSFNPGAITPPAHPSGGVPVRDSSHQSQDATRPDPPPE